MSSVPTTTEALPLRPVRLKPRRSDQQFLPAALSILERPASPVATVLALTICAFTLAALAWAWFGSTDIIALANGKVQAIGKTRSIHAAETGRIIAIHAVNGSRVGAGDVLFEVDSGDAREDVQMLALALASARAEMIRRQAAVDAATRGTYEPGAVTWSSDVPEHVRRREQAALDADVAHFQALLQAIELQRVQKQSERERLLQTMKHLEGLLAVLQERLDMQSALMKTAAGKRAGVLEAMEGLQQQRVTFSQAERELDQATRTLDALDGETRKTLQVHVAEHTSRLVEAARQVDELTPRLAKARLAVSRAKVLSPVDGVVQTSVLTTIGQVLSTGQEAMRIVPTDESLEIEVYLPNKDVGFVRVGQDATVKIEAFPYTRFGTMPATIVSVAADAIPEPDARLMDWEPGRIGQARGVGAGQQMQELVFPVILRTKENFIQVHGRPQRLSPGMRVTAEIHTGRRRIIDYVLGPLVEVTSEAGRER